MKDIIYSMFVSMFFLLGCNQECEKFNARTDQVYRLVLNQYNENVQVCVMAEELMVEMFDIEKKSNNVDFYLCSDNEVLSLLGKMRTSSLCDFFESVCIESFSVISDSMIVMHPEFKSINNDGCLYFNFDIVFSNKVIKPEPESDFIIRHIAKNWYLRASVNTM